MEHQLRTVPVSKRGTPIVIDVLMDVRKDETGRVNMFFVLKRTLSFVAEMETSIKTEWKK